MIHRVRSLLVLLAFVVFGAAAQDKACSAADKNNAEKAIDRIANWDQLYRAFQEYRHCDKGSVDDSFTDALLTRVVEWKQVDRLQQSMEKDKDYRAFVLRHLASPAATGDVESVYSRARMSCPKGLDDFCKEIATTVKPMSAITAPAAPAAPAATGAAATPAPAVPPKK